MLVSSMRCVREFCPTRQRASHRERPRASLEVVGRRVVPERALLTSLVVVLQLLKLLDEHRDRGPRVLLVDAELAVALGGAMTGVGSRGPGLWRVR